MMKHKVIVLFLLVMHVCIDGTWKVGKIFNYSNLDLMSASYVHPKSKKISRLTNLLMAADKSKKPVVIDFNYLVSDTSSGLSMIQANNGYFLTLDYNPVHHVKTGRKKVKHKNVAKDPKIKKNYGNLAQVYLAAVSPQDDQVNDVAHAVLEYEQSNPKEPVVIDIYLFNLNSGPANYSIKLMKAVIPKVSK